MSTGSAHSAPPAVELEAGGRHRDIPVITLDLEGGTIAASMVRRLALSLCHARRTMLLSSIVAGPSRVLQDQMVAEVLGYCRERAVFQVALTHDAAAALYERLGEVLEVAETTCRREGCRAVGLCDGLCAAHVEALDRRVVTA